MKIQTKVTTIECSADELRQSNSLADSIVSVIRGCFNGVCTVSDDLEDDDEHEDSCD